MRLEFSKIIFIIVTTITVLVTFFSCYLMVKTLDTSPLGYLIPAIFAEFAATTGFYYSKAKAENKIKLMK